MKLLLPLLVLVGSVSLLVTGWSATALTFR